MHTFASNNDQRANKVPKPASKMAVLDRLTKTMVGFDTGREQTGLLTAMAARQKLADLAELQTDAELNGNSQFLEMREAIRTTAGNIGVHFWAFVFHCVFDCS